MTEVMSTTQLDIATLKFVLALSGAVIGVLILSIGFFVSRAISDLKDNTEEIGNNKGTIELVKLQQEQDIKRIEERTQLELRQLTEQIGGLAMSVQTLVDIQIRK